MKDQMFDSKEERDEARVEFIIKSVKNFFVKKGFDLSDATTEIKNVEYESGNLKQITICADEIPAIGQASAFINSFDVKIEITLIKDEQGFIDMSGLHSVGFKVDYEHTQSGSNGYTNLYIGLCQDQVFGTLKSFDLIDRHVFLNAQRILAMQ